MKKMVIIILLILFFGIYEVSAKEIIIDNIIYDDNSDINGDGYYYQSNSKILYLDGYNGGSIIYDDLLELRVENTNVINGDGMDAISCMEASIYGNGILNIYNAASGINCERLQIQLTKIYISKSNIGINTSGIEIYLDQMNLVVEDSRIGIYAPDSIFAGYSKINIINCDLGITNDFLKIMALYDSVLYIKTRDYCLFNIQIVDIVRSKVALESSGMTLNDQNILESDMNMIYVSNNKENYFIDEEYLFYPFIKIASKEKIDELLISDEGLIIEVDKNFLDKNDDNANEEDSKVNEEEKNEGDDDINEEEKAEEDDDINEDGSKQEEKDDDVLEDGEVDEENSSAEKDDDFNEESDNDIGLEVITKSEYTEGEFPKLEFVNPSTIDNIYIFLSLFTLSFLILIATYLLRSKHE